MNKVSRPFSNLPLVSAPAGLREAVHQRILALERRISRMKISSLVALALASIAGLVASCIYVWDMLAASGFVQYASLIFSDGAVLAYSKDLALTLIESLPALGIALVLSAALVSVGSVWSFFRVFRQASL